MLYEIKKNNFNVSFNCKICSLMIFVSCNTFVTVSSPKLPDLRTLVKGPGELDLDILVTLGEPLSSPLGHAR